jgi:hypothetical protein
MPLLTYDVEMKSTIIVIVVHNASHFHILHIIQYWNIEVNKSDVALSKMGNIIRIFYGELPPIHVETPNLNISLFITWFSNLLSKPTPMR